MVITNREKIIVLFLVAPLKVKQLSSKIAAFLCLFGGFPLKIPLFSVFFVLVYTSHVNRDVNHLVPHQSLFHPKISKRKLIRLALLFFYYDITSFLKKRTSS